MTGEDPNKSGVEPLPGLQVLWQPGLHSLGVRKGDRVALLLYNRAEYVRLLVACFRLGGAIALPMN